MNFKNTTIIVAAIVAIATLTIIWKIDIGTAILVDICLGAAIGMAKIGDVFIKQPTIKLILNVIILLAFLISIGIVVVGYKSTDAAERHNLMYFGLVSITLLIATKLVKFEFQE